MSHSMRGKLTFVVIGVAWMTVAGVWADPGHGKGAAESSEEVSPLVPSTHDGVPTVLEGTSGDAAEMKRLVPITKIPDAVPNTDPRIEESMTIRTSELHGFSDADLEEAANEHIAMITGAEPASSQHPSVAGFGRYEIGAGDILEFVSFDDELLNREVTVRYDGYVSLPRVRDIKVGGLTRQEAEEAIRQAYSAIYRAPDISLTIQSTESKTFVVTGDVEEPGRYPYTRVTSLWDAITLAGGLRQPPVSSSGGFVGLAGQITKAIVIRHIDGERKVYTYDMRGLGRPGEYKGDTQIYYGDIVYVPEGVNLVYLLGESRSPITVQLTEGMTLLQMLALSGGFDPSTARLRDVVLLRQVDDTNTDVHLVNLREILKGEARDIPLVPGDVVYIPRKRVLRLSEFVARFTGSVSPIFDMYTSAVDSIFQFQINRETLDALERANSTSVGARGVTTLPRTVGGTNTP